MAGKHLRKREVGLPPERDIPSDDAIRLANEMTPGRDLRNSTRRALHCPVTLRFGGAKYCGETIDISGGGVLLRTECPVTTGSSVHCTIELPGDAFGMKTSVKVNCRGRVTRCSPASNCRSRDVAIVIDDYHFQSSRKRPLNRPCERRLSIIRPQDTDL